MEVKMLFAKFSFLWSKRALHCLPVDIVQSLQLEMAFDYSSCSYVKGFDGVLSVAKEQ
jgi:hypothetical protein